MTGLGTASSSSSVLHPPAAAESVSWMSITNDPGKLKVVSLEGPAVSPDGQRILYIRPGWTPIESATQYHRKSRLSPQHLRAEAGPPDPLQFILKREVAVLV